jgi:hypothetical protein
MLLNVDVMYLREITPFNAAPNAVQRLANCNQHAVMRVWLMHLQISILSGEQAGLAKFYSSQPVTERVFRQSGS